MQTPTQTPSLSSSSSSSPNSPPHSSLTLASSSSSSSSQSPSLCIGLNLLVKAIHQITAGSVVGVPYIQRRIITRRKKPIHFNNLIISTSPDLHPKSKSKMKTVRQRRANVTMPLKFKDSVLQPLTPKRRSDRLSSSVKIIGE